MDLTGRVTFAVMIGLVLASIGGTVWVWERMPRSSWARWPSRVALIVVCQLSACALAAVALNDTDRFYNSWTELAGGKQSTVHHIHPQPSVFTDELNRQLTQQHHRPGTSAIIAVPVPEAGSRHGGTHTAQVYLPAAYFDPVFSTRQFPVIELLDGYPGSPQTWIGPLHLQHTADTEITAGRAGPFIAVMPVQNYPPGDGECLNVPDGPQVESSLLTEVRDTVLADLRVSPERRSWAVMGYSTGGYCALNLSLRHPQDFTAAVSILGNTSPYQDATTGPVFTKHPGLREQNDPMWLLTHTTVQPDLAVLLATSSGDKSTALAAQAFTQLARPPLRVQQIKNAVGGHNFQTFNLYEPIALDWLSAQLRPPLAPTPTITH